MVLDNNLVMANQVHRAEDEFSKMVNGYKPGDTVNLRKPADFEVREGAIASNQEVIEGKVPLVVDSQAGVDFQFTSKDLTLNIKDLSQRVIKPAMVQLANYVDVKLMGLYKYVPNWVGTPGQEVNSFADFSLATERLDETAVPMSDRSAVLSPADHWGMLSSQTALFIQDAAKGAYREGSLGKIGGVDTYMAQNVPAHVVGSDVTDVTVNQALTALTTSYDDVKDNHQQTITIAGGNVNAGDVFTIADVYEVNPVTKVSTGQQKQFTVISYSSNSLTFSPAIIWDGAFQNASITSGVTDLTGKAMTFQGTAGTSYRQNMVFHKNAFALAMVPMEKPAGAVDVARKTYKGLSVRVIPYYDGVNDVSNYRLDILFGVKAIDPRLATRLSGTN